MIKTLRRKFILIASCVILVILTVVLLFVNLSSYISSYTQSMAVLNYIVNNYGRMPDITPQNGEVDFFVSREIRFETRYFTVILDPENNFFDSDYEHIAALTDSETKAMYTFVLDHNSSEGILRLYDSTFVYRTRYITAYDLENELDYEDDDLDYENRYMLIAFMDCTNRFYSVHSMWTMSFIAGLLFFAVFVVLVSVFSRRAIRPAIEYYEKQKMFITNAGHELKTPLAIISANTEVIETMEGSNEWTQSTMKQVKRLTGLINDLISMARLDEAAESEHIEMNEFDFSAVTRDTAEGFRTLVEQQGKTLSTQIDDGIRLNGNEKMLTQLVSILMDNAVKYCDDGGMISIMLTARKKQALLTVSNSYTAEKPVDCSKFFDRFYREDTSHNSGKSGYGIGLSMAEATVKLHKGKITAIHKNNIISFNVTLDRGTENKNQKPKG